MYRTGFHKASIGVCRGGGLRAISAVIAPGGISRLPGHGAVADALGLSRCLWLRPGRIPRHGDLRNRLQGSCDRRSWLLRLSGLRFVRRGEGQGARPARREGTTATKAPESAEPDVEARARDPDRTRPPPRLGSSSNARSTRGNIFLLSRWQKHAY